MWIYIGLLIFAVIAIVASMSVMGNKRVDSSQVAAPMPVVIPTPAPMPVVLAPLPDERTDARCGASYSGAKCGTGRCCSIYGWCGSAGEPHCTKSINVPEYNGPDAVIV